MTVKILIRRDTTSNWLKTLSILKEGEFGIEICEDGSRKIKIGDGLREWAALPYAYISVDEFVAHLTDINAHNINELIAALENENTVIKDEIITINTNIASINNKVITLENNSATITDNLNSLTNEVNQNKETSDTNFTSINGSISALNTKVISLETSNTNLNNAITGLDNKINQNKNEVDAEINNLKERTNTLETSDTTNKSDIQTLKNEVDNIKQNTDYVGLAQTIARVDVLETDAVTTNDRLNNLESDNGNNKSNIAIINENLSSVTNRVNNLETANANMVQDMDSLKDDIHGKVANAQNDITNLQSDVTNIKWDIANIQNSGVNTASDLSNLETRFEDYVTQNNIDMSEVHTDITNIKWDIQNIRNTESINHNANLDAIAGIKAILDEHIENCDIDIKSALNEFIDRIDTDIVDIKDDIKAIKEYINMANETNLSELRKILEDYMEKNNMAVENHISDSEAHGINNIKSDIITINTEVGNHINDTNAHGIDSIKSDIVNINSEVENIKDKIENIDIVSIKGSVDTYANLPDASTLIVGTAYIVEKDENKNDITTVYMVTENDGIFEWEFIAEFRVDLTNYYTKDEVDNLKNEVINLNADYSTSEVDTGLKWIDGKKIYRRVFTGTTDTSISFPKSNLSEMLFIKGFCGASNNTRYSANAYYGGSNYWYVVYVPAAGNPSYPGTFVITRNGDCADKSYWFIAEYTKD